MNETPTIRDRLAKAFGPALIILTLAYFAFHAVQGNYGLTALKDLDNQLALLKPQAEEVKDHRAELEANVDRLRPDNLDPDMLDEQVRRRLGFSNPREVFVLTDK